VSYLSQKVQNLCLSSLNNDKSETTARWTNTISSSVQSGRSAGSFNRTNRTFSATHVVLHRAMLEQTSNQNSVSTG